MITATDYRIGLVKALDKQWPYLTVVQEPGHKSDPNTHFRLTSTVASVDENGGYQKDIAVSLRLNNLNGTDPEHYFQQQMTLLVEQARIKLAEELLIQVVTLNSHFYGLGQPAQYTLWATAKMTGFTGFPSGKLVNLYELMEGPDALDRRIAAVDVLYGVVIHLPDGRTIAPSGLLTVQKVDLLIQKVWGFGAA